MVKQVAKLVTSRWMLAVLLTAAVWALFPTRSRGLRDQLDEPRRQVAELACWRVVEGLPKLPSPGEVAVLRLEGDSTGFVTEQLRAVIDRTGTYVQPAAGLVDRVMKELEIEERSAGSPAEAIAVGRRMKVPYVLSGRVVEFRSDRQVGQIRLVLQLVDVGKARSVGEAVEVSYPEQGLRSGAWSVAWRTVLWMAVVGVFPLLTLPVIRQVLTLESNLITLIALLSCTALAGILALALTGFALGRWSSVGLIVIATGVAGSYDYYVFEVVDKRR